MIKAFLLFLLFISNAQAATVTIPTTWVNGDTVTAVKLNNINTTFAAALNGGLDNTNANTVGGYHFFTTVSTLPAAGNQGSVSFQTSDNTLNIDNGATWQSGVFPSGTLGTGKIPVYNSGWGLLAPGTNKLPLVSNGASSLPSYQQLDLTAGVTGALPGANMTTSIPVGNLNTGTGATSSTFWRGDGTWNTPSYTQISGSYAAGDYLIFSDGNINVTTSASDTKIFEYYLPRGGTLRIKFWLFDAGNGANGRIYRNGVAVGTARVGGGVNGTQYSEDISGWTAGDLLQLYLHSNTGANNTYGGALQLFENAPPKESLNLATYTQQRTYINVAGGTPATIKANGLGAIGDIYLDQAGGATTTLYVKTGATTWTAK